MKLRDIMDLDLFDEMVKRKYISVRTHPDLPLRICNYTRRASCDGVWNEATSQCRGLIIDDDTNIISRPMRKFWETKGDHTTGTGFRVFEKLDGSLGISYQYGGKVGITSRGSFEGWQGIEATRLLHEKYEKAAGLMRPDMTYLFEIILPENRIVVDYAGERSLVLLHILDSEGVRASDEMHLQMRDSGMPLVKEYTFASVEDVVGECRSTRSNAEGYVILFSDGSMCKVKYEWYKKAHAFMATMSEVRIWEMLRSDGQNKLLGVINSVPEPLKGWATDKMRDLVHAYDSVISTCRHDFRVLSTRKETALFFKSCRYPAVLFAMLDGRDYRSPAWAAVRPKGNETPRDLFGRNTKQVQTP